MKPKESVECHQTLSSRVGSGDETSTRFSRGHTPFCKRGKGLVTYHCSLALFPGPAQLSVAGRGLGTRLTAANLLHRNSFTHAL